DRVLGHWPAVGRALLADSVEPADLALARNQDGGAGQGSLVDLALEAVGQLLQPRRGQADRFRLGVGKRRGLRVGGVLGGSLGVHELLPGALSGFGEVWRRTYGLNRAFGRFALANGAWPMLE